MWHELGPSDFFRVRPLFRPHFQDPLLHAVLEGQRPGRVFTDSPRTPRAAFVWTNSESAYWVREIGDGSLDAALQRLLQAEIVPATETIGKDFISLFSFPNAHSDELEEQLAGMLPLRTPVSTFSFNRRSYSARHDRPAPLPPGHTLRPIDLKILDGPDQAYLAQEIALHWGSIEPFFPELGHCVLKDGQVVSWCYVQAVGGGAQTIDVWTAAAHRRKGLATAVTRAFIEQCLAAGHRPFWLCDKANTGSHKLAEGLGFEYTGDLWLVDIPLRPFEFYRGLALGFFLPSQEYRQAAEMLQRAFDAQEGAAEDYYQAAIAWALTGDATRAVHFLQAAASRGWRDFERASKEKAFTILHGTPEWEEWLAGSEQ